MHRVRLSHPPLSIKHSSMSALALLGDKKKHVRVTTLPIHPEYPFPLYPQGHEPQIGGCPIRFVQLVSESHPPREHSSISDHKEINYLGTPISYVWANSFLINTCAIYVAIYIISPCTRTTCSGNIGYHGAVA